MKDEDKLRKEEFALQRYKMFAVVKDCKSGSDPRQKKLREEGRYETRMNESIHNNSWILADGKDQAPHNSTEGLFDLIDECVTEETIIVEIGSYRGVSAECFAAFCKKIYAVDPWDRVEMAKDVGGPLADIIELQCRERLRGYENVEIIKDFSANASLLFEDESIDMVYIDGNHSYEACKKDAESWYPKVKEGGVISGHDSSNEGVKKAIAEVLGFDLSDEAKVKKYKDDSWSFKKLN